MRSTEYSGKRERCYIKKKTGQLGNAKRQSSSKLQKE
jgi:hypothetical protein